MQQPELRRAVIGQILSGGMEANLQRAHSGSRGLSECGVCVCVCVAWNVPCESRVHYVVRGAEANLGLGAHQPRGRARRVDEDGAKLRAVPPRRRIGGVGALDRRLPRGTWRGPWRYVSYMAVPWSHAGGKRGLSARWIVVT